MLNQKGYEQRLKRLGHPILPQQAMLRQITGELAKDIKTEADLNKILNQFVKMTVEAALGAEMEHHLGYAKSATEAVDAVEPKALRSALNISRSLF